MVTVHGDHSSFKKWLVDMVKMENPVIGEKEDSENIKELSTYMYEVTRRFDEFIWKIEEIRLEASKQ